MKLVCTARPHPEWTLSRCAKALYGNTAKPTLYMSAMPSWGETIETLREFVELKALGNYEWGHEAKRLLDEMEREVEGVAEEKPTIEAESCCWYNTFLSATVVASVGAFACISPVLLHFLFD
jgi:hypothetical protein